MRATNTLFAFLCCALCAATSATAMASPVLSVAGAPALLDRPAAPARIDRCDDKYRTAAALLDAAIEQLEEDAARTNGDPQIDQREQEYIDRLKNLAQRVRNLDQNDANAAQVKADLRKFLGDLRGTDASSRAVRLVRRALDAMDCK